MSEPTPHQDEPRPTAAAMSRSAVRAALDESGWTYLVDHPYDLSMLPDQNTGPFEQLEQARAAAAVIDELVAGNCD